MKNLIRVSILAALGAALSLVAPPANAQLYTQVETTLSAAVASSGQTTMTLTSVTGVVVTNNQASPYIGTVLYIIDAGQMAGELAYVTGVNTTTKVVSVRRGMNGTKAVTHANAALVIISLTSNIKPRDPQGSCVTASTNETPWINSNTGAQWLCSTVTLTWVPGWQNVAVPPAVTTAVASAAGVVVPSGPLFHITGTAAITGFTNASMIGFMSGCFTVIPDGVFTWTTATNIALAGTAVVSKALTFCWDANAAKWYPNYIA